MGSAGIVDFGVLWLSRVLTRLDSLATSRVAAVCLAFFVCTSSNPPSGENAAETATGSDRLAWVRSGSMQLREVS
jgi:hypothetical protein